MTEKHGSPIESLGDDKKRVQGVEDSRGQVEKDRRQKTGDRRQKTEDRRQEMIVIHSNS